MSTFKKSGAVGAVLAILLVRVTLFAQVYAVPVQSTPGDGRTIRSSPRYVSITFNAALDPSASQIEVFDEQGKRVDRDDCGIDVADPSRKTMISTLKPDLEPGVYTVRWTTVADDSSTDTDYLVQGQYEFTIARSIAQLVFLGATAVLAFLFVIGGWLGFGLTYRRLRRVEARLAQLE